MEVTKWLKPSVACHELVSPDFRNGSCVTSIAGPNGGAQLYER